MELVAEQNKVLKRISRKSLAERQQRSLDMRKPSVTLPSSETLKKFMQEP